MVHYRIEKNRTLCGRPVGIMVNLTTDPRKITCIHCKCSPALDGTPGNMTHTGH